MSWKNETMPLSIIYMTEKKRMWIRPSVSLKAVEKLLVQIMVNLSTWLIILYPESNMHAMLLM